MNSLRNLSIISLLSLVASGLSGCGRQETKNEDTERAQSDALYTELVQVYKAYTDTLSVVFENDTTGKVEDYLTSLEKKVWDIYKRYPMNLDSRLTEAQNDSLWHYTERIIQARQRFLRQQVPETVTPDSVPGDSIENR